MAWRHALVVCVLVLAGCGLPEQTPAPPTAAPVPSQPPVPASADDAATAFFTAWQQASTSAMYDLLSSSAQAATPRDVFVRRYSNIHDGIGETEAHRPGHRPGHRDRSDHQPGARFKPPTPWPFSATSPSQHAAAGQGAGRLESRLAARLDLHGPDRRHDRPLHPGHSRAGPNPRPRRANRWPTTARSWSSASSQATSRTRPRCCKACPMRSASARHDQAALPGRAANLVHAHRPALRSRPRRSPAEDRLASRRGPPGQAGPRLSARAGRGARRSATSGTRPPTSCTSSPAAATTNRIGSATRASRLRPNSAWRAPAAASSRSSIRRANSCARLPRRRPCTARTSSSRSTPTIQTAAASALGDKTGSVVILDPRDNSLLALASQPSFDPNQFVDRPERRPVAAAERSGPPAGAAGDRIGLSHRIDLQGDHHGRRARAGRLQAVQHVQLRPGLDRAARGDAAQLGCSRARST